MPFNPKQPAYKRLRTLHAEQRRPVVFWVGAGLSIPAGLPSWIRLRDILVGKAIEIAALLPEPEGRAKEVEIDRAANADSLWDSFQILKKELGKSEFREEIREILGHQHASAIPQCYSEIWTLPGVRGVLSLNIDEFAGRSHKRVRLSEDPAVFSGKEAADYAHVLGDGRAFIGNLHGVIDSQKSWVFTRDEISSLVNTPGYKEFISLIFGQMTVVFCGISAEDSAAGGYLESLTRSGLDLGPHFWITDRIDEATHGWAANAGIGVIRYNPVIVKGKTPDHVSVLLELFSDMKSFISKDEKAKPVIANIAPVDSIPSPDELRLIDEDELRELLSGYAKKLLDQGLDTSSKQYSKFLSDYAQRIHQAWYISDRRPLNKFYGYEIEKRISTSPFSTVWRLRDKDNQPLALKVLRIENLESGPEIESLRRGIQSLRYLTNAEIPGTATLKDAYEIPTSVVMEFVEGQDLQSLVDGHSFDGWTDALPVMINVCRHLRFGHNLPQGVLHRDVRPSNIMVPNFYWADDTDGLDAKKHEVKLLNYDMSWHASAKGQTIAGNIEQSGYYAPEHTSSTGELSRSTSVDCYGVGMCIYFAFTGESPPAAGSKSTDWPDLLQKHFRPANRVAWRSAPVRLRRLIEHATAANARDRPMMDQIEAELRMLQRAVGGNFRSLPAQVWAEELLSRSEEAEYQALPGGLKFVREPRPGRTIMLEGDTGGNRVILTFRNAALGGTDRTGIDRLWSDKLSRARDVLSASGWNIEEGTRYASHEILMSASIDVEDLKDKVSKIVGGLKRGLTQVKVE